MIQHPSLPALLTDLRTRLEVGLVERAKPWWHNALEAASGAGPLAIHFPGLGRRLGRPPLVEPTATDRFFSSGDVLLDLAAFRTADVGAMLLVHAHLEADGDPAVLRDLYDHGDLEERVGVMRSLLVVPPDHPVVQDLLGEAQRANAVDIYEAAWCDHDLAARVLSEADFNRMVLKLAFTNLPLWRVLRATERANPELSRMLEDFALEREAAGRPVWPDTVTLMAHAPVDGSRERIARHAAEGSDDLRALAQAALAHLS